MSPIPITILQKMTFLINFNTLTPVLKQTSCSELCHELYEQATVSFFLDDCHSLHTDCLTSSLVFRLFRQQPVMSYNMNMISPLVCLTSSKGFSSFRICIYFFVCFCFFAMAQKPSHCQSPVFLSSLIFCYLSLSLSLILSFLMDCTMNCVSLTHQASCHPRVFALVIPPT